MVCIHTFLRFFYAKWSSDFSLTQLLRLTCNRTGMVVWWLAAGSLHQKIQGTLVVIQVPRNSVFFFFFGKSYPLPPMMMEVEDGVKPPKKTCVLNGSWIYHFLWVREEKFWRFRMEHVHEKPLKTNEYEKSPESWCLGSMIHWMKVCSSPKSQGSTMAPGRRLPWTWGEEPLCQLAQWG